MKYFIWRFFALIFLFPSAISSIGQDMLKVIGINRVAHRIDTSMKYKQPHSKDLSARYQLFIQNLSSEPLKSSGNKMPMINEQTAEAWHKHGNIAWYQFPQQDETFPEQIPAKAMMVWQFNGINNGWIRNSALQFSLKDLDTLITDQPQAVYIEQVTFTGSEQALIPDLATIHLFNQSNNNYQVEDVIFWQANTETGWQFLFPGKSLKPNFKLPADGVLVSDGKAVIQVTSKAFQPGLAAIQVILRDLNGSVLNLWAYQKIKKETFDISAGWANGNLNGKPAFLNEKFLQSLKALYINAAHYNGQSGFTDRPNLFLRYPIKYFGHLKPWKQYDQDSILNRMHGIEILGEPQYGGGTPVDPQKVAMELLPYEPSRIPTTLTHSEERIWRFYAGLSDYPHFDAYRVTAPSADEWGLYDRWKGKRIEWGSPLETIGTMTRSLKLLNRPFPIAYWSQGPHEGWEVYGGRKLTSPTPSELRMQAYQALSTGITSLYWFNLSYKSLMLYPELLLPMQRIGREIRLLESFYLFGTQWFYQRKGSEQTPLWDFSTLVAPDGVLLFALDLDYQAEGKTKTFVFAKDKNATLEFKIPEWIGKEWQLLKLEETDFRRITFQMESSGKIHFQDRITEAGIYVLVEGEEKALQLMQKQKYLLEAEQKLEFDPVNNPKHRTEFLKMGN